MTPTAQLTFFFSHWISGIFCVIVSVSCFFLFIYISFWRREKTALSGLSDLASANITVNMGGASGACEDSNTVNTSIAVELQYGNYPLQVI